MSDTRVASAGVDEFVARARALTDDDRVALARARAAIDEPFHAGAWRAATEIAMERAEAYLHARLRLGDAFVPDRLVQLVSLGERADPEELARWQDVARLVRIALDDVLLARLGAARIRPPDLRQLNGPWRAMLDAAHDRAVVS